MRAVATALLLALGFGASPARAAVEGPGVNLYFHASRTRAPVNIDGKLDEEDWAKTETFDDFKERFPNAGAPPSERTELKVLYDDRAVYVAVICHDSEPALINRQMGRRDSNLLSDATQVIIDAAHDHRTAYLFGVGAGGMLSDGILYDDSNYSGDWDAIWDGAAGSFEGGWIAEFAIPLHLLRFPKADVQTWGFSVRRDLARKGEEIEAVHNARSSGASVSRIGHLTGMEGLAPRRTLELLPYLAARAVLRPQFSDPSTPNPRLLNPSGDLGIDVNAALTSDLALTATVNPDFGQVEADQLIQNLSTFETFFPEKRPFFNQGFELFQPVGAQRGRPPHALFYSRRIGLSAPIFAAAKVTGKAARGVDIAVLDALVASAYTPVDDEAQPDRSLALRKERPLHLGLADELPRQPVAASNFLAAVGRFSLGERLRLGATVTSAIPFTRPCTEEDEALPFDERPAACLTRGANAAAVDFDWTTSDSHWAARGQVSLSQAHSGPQTVMLRDGTRLDRGDVGVGAYLKAGRYGGEGLRLELSYEYSTPTLELNAVGYQRIQNTQGAGVMVGYERLTDLSIVRALRVNSTFSTSFSTDGRGLHRGNTWVGSASVTLPSFDFIGIEVGSDFGGYNLRELGRTGVPLQQPGFVFFSLFGDSKQDRTVVFGGNAAVGVHMAAGPTPLSIGWGGNLYGSVKPHAALETRLEVGFDRTPHGPRYRGDLGLNRFLLGELNSYFLSLTLRQQWILNPRLSLQAYAQLFSEYGTFWRFFVGETNDARAPIELSSLTLAPENSDVSGFYGVALNLNVVLRWEYRLGSTLYLVYTRAQGGLPYPPGEEPATLAPRQLLLGPAQDAIMLKWSYYTDL